MRNDNLQGLITNTTTKTADFSTLTWHNVAITGDACPNYFKYASFGPFYILMMRFNGINVSFIGQLICSWDVNTVPFRFNQNPYRVELGTDLPAGRVACAFDCQDGYINAYPQVQNQISGSISAKLYGDITILLPK